MSLKRDKRGVSVGNLIAIVIAVLFVGALIVTVAQQRGTMVDLASAENESLGTMTNGTALYITNYKYCTGFKIFNATGDVEIPSGNYTVTNNVVYNGNEAIQVDPLIDAGGRAKGYNVGTATFDGTCQPLTYDNNSASRTVSGLILLFCALALLAYLLEKSEIIDLFGR